MKIYESIYYLIFYFYEMFFVMVEESIIVTNSNFLRVFLEGMVDKAKYFMLEEKGLVWRAHYTFWERGGWLIHLWPSFLI